MKEEQSAYRSIFKATSIFGGVQVINIIITLIRGKALAILLGPAGMGLNGLFQSGLNLIKVASSLGLEQSAVRDISAAHTSGDTDKINRTFTVFRRWIWITAVLGVLLTLVFSPLLSRFSFGTGEHTWSFVLLSVTFVFTALAGGIYTFLRGTRKIKALAQANVLGALAGLLVALPIFYFFGIKGVVPAIIATALANYLISLFFRRKVSFEKVKLTLKETLKEGGGMVKLGISLSISTLIATAVNYLVIAFITRKGSLSDVGLYSAGLTIVSSYVGMVFTAMGTDYFPRLSGIIDKPEQWKTLVKQQAELVILILGPVLAVLLATAPILIRIILSAEFLPVIDFLTWAVLGLLLKGVVWAMGFVLIAKGNNKLFLITEFIANILALGLNLYFYYILGIKGLGISLFLGYTLVLIMMILLLKKKYNFHFGIKFFGMLAVFFLLLSSLLVGIIFLGYPNSYYLGAIISVLTIVIALKGLNNRLNLKAIYFSLFKKKQ